MVTANPIVQAITVLFEHETDGITKVVFPTTKNLEILHTGHGASVEMEISFTPLPAEKTGITHFVLDLKKMEPEILPNLTLVETPDGELWVRVPVAEEDELCWQGLNHKGTWMVENWLDHKELKEQTFTIISMPIKAEEVMHA